MSVIGTITRRKAVSAPLTLSERAAEASLNGAVALDVFETAAAGLEAAATELDAVALEAEEERLRILEAAQRQAAELRNLSTELDAQAGGHRLRAVRIRDLISVPTAVVS